MSRRTAVQSGIAVLTLAILGLSVTVGAMGFWELAVQILLTVAGVVLALWYADLGKPRLTLQALPPESVRVGDVQTLFLKLTVHNDPLSNLPFISRSTAFSCHGTVAVLGEQETSLFSMPIRWSNNPQPIRPDADQGKVVTMIDPSLIRLSRFIDIPADESEELDICYRVPSEHEAIGWNSDSYWIPGGRFPDRILPPGEYTVRVMIRHNDGAAHAQFLLHNAENIQGYSLETWTPKMPRN